MLFARRSIVYRKKLREKEACISPSFTAGEPTALDVAITSALQASLISDVARTFSYALSLPEGKFIEQYYKRCSKMGIHFIPMALEIFGRLSETVSRTPKRLVLFADNRAMQPSDLSIAFNGFT